MNSRDLAYIALMKFDSSQERISAILDSLLQTNRLSQRDKKFYFNLTNGVLRHRNLLDWKASNYYHGKYVHAHNKLKNLLRLAFYEIEFLDHIPPRATVNEYVNLARKKLNSKAASLLNAVLRNSLRDKNPPDPQKKFKYTATQLSVKYSYPEWLIKRWIGVWGEERTEYLCRSMNHRPDFDVHINPAKITDSDFEKQLLTNGIGFNRSSYSEQVFKITDVQSLQRTGWLKDGICRVQDESGRIPVELLSPKKNSMVLDACAAPGSKFVTLKDIYSDEINLIGAEIFEDRISRLSQNCATWGIRPHHLVLSDSLQPPFNRIFDHILLDVPCSGLGTIQKNPDIKWRRKEDELPEFQKLQLSLLNSMSNLIKPGGTIVYSTCTIDQMENEEVVDKFLHQHKDTFQIIAPEHKNLRPFIEGNFIRTYPDKHEMEGSFAAKLYFSG
jgi:16S rRNA (cytosine967-C5)-methyltransferase